MKILLVRHGQTEWNVLGKVQGKADIELNEKGIEVKAAQSTLDDDALGLVRKKFGKKEEPEKINKQK